MLVLNPFEKHISIEVKMGTFQGDNEQDLKAKQVFDILLTNCFSSNPFET